MNQEKKDKKTLDFLKAEMITIKMIGHSVSLVKKKKIKVLQEMF